MTGDGPATIVIHAHENDTLMVSCCALDTGFTPFHQYEWTRLDADMPAKAVGENSTTLFIPAMAAEDVGVYTCRGSLDGDVSNQSVQVFIIGGPYGGLWFSMCFSIRHYNLLYNLKQFSYQDFVTGEYYFISN